MGRRKRLGLRAPTVVDLVAFDPQSDQYVLVMTQQEPFDGSEAEFQDVQEKINAYLYYVTEGQLDAQHPDARDRGVRIHLDHYEPLPPDLEELVAFARESLAPHGIDVSLGRVEPPETET